MVCAPSIPLIRLLALQGVGLIHVPRFSRKAASRVEVTLDTEVHLLSGLSENMKIIISSYQIDLPRHSAFTQSTGSQY